MMVYQYSLYDTLPKMADSSEKEWSNDRLAFCCGTDKVTSHHNVSGSDSCHITHINWMTLRRPTIDVDASACHNNALKYLTLLWAWLWPVDLQNLISSTVTSTTSSIKARSNSIKWIIRFHANRMHIRMDARMHPLMGEQLLKHNASNIKMSEV